MTSIRSLAPAFLLLGASAPLTGCLGTSEPTVCTGQQEALMTNGIYINGPFLNGVQLQGVNLQGIDLNGRDLGGLSPAVSLEGTEPVVDVAGETLRGEDLVGAEIDAVGADGSREPLTIAAAAVDADDPDLFYVSLEDVDGQNVCGADGRGLFVEGVWDQRTGERLDSFEVDGQTIHASYSCTTGVIAKCLRWGYHPWESGADLHQTCTRMARADYCGNGVPHTENGTPIDLFDVQGIQVSESSPADGFVFEAGWGPDGAVCVDHPRYLDIGPNGDEQLPSCFESLPRCTDWQSAQSHGALTGDASVPQTRLLCE